MSLKYFGLFVLSVFIASCSQILLKSSADKVYEKRWQEYLNLRVIVAYGILFLSLVLATVAYRGIPLSYGPMIDSLGYVFVGTLGWLFLKEKLTKGKCVGIILIIVGIFIMQAAG